jgi:hypothetical protein
VCQPMPNGVLRNNRTAIAIRNAMIASHFIRHQSMCMDMERHNYTSQSTLGFCPPTVTTSCRSSSQGEGSQPMAVADGHEALEVPGQARVNVKESLAGCPTSHRPRTEAGAPRPVFGTWASAVAASLRGRGAKTRLPRVTTECYRVKLTADSEPDPWSLDHPIPRLCETWGTRIG